MKRLAPHLDIFRRLTSVPTAPFREQAVIARAMAWIGRTLGRAVTVRRLRGGIVVEYRKAPGPSLALAAHLDHPGFDLFRVSRRGARARLQGGHFRETLPGAAVQAFPARPSGNEPLAEGVLREPAGDVYPVRWTRPPAAGAKPVFAVLALTPFSARGPWLSSRSIDDLFGCALSLEALRRVVRARLKTNLKVLLNRAEEVGFIGAMDLAASKALAPGDSVLSIETSRAMAGARPGRGPVIRVGDRSSLFDPNLLALLDSAAAKLPRRAKIQRARLTGGSCEATAYLALGYEAAGVAIPLLNYHNGGKGRVAPEKVRLEDAEGCVRLLVEAARLFPAAALRGRLRDRLIKRHRVLAPRLGR